MEKLKNDLFLRACKRQPVERTPIWIMRQAGRYLPEYQAVRAKADFLTMCKTPELAAEVTIQPIDILEVDAAIIFSDILVIPEAMGMHLVMHEGKGPIFHNPIRNENDARFLKKINPEKELKYVLDAVRLTKKELNNRVPLIGFSGSPWTLLTYMVEGRGSKNFSEVKKLIYNNPKLAHQLLSDLSDTIAGYLSAKIGAGCNAVQIFDTWGGILSQKDFLEFSLPYVERIISQIKRNDEPVIFFAKGVHHNLIKMADIGADVLGLDWTMNLGEVRKLVGNRVALQGNLDPTVLYANKNYIKQEVISVLQSFGEGSGHIFNLGHGVLPDVDPENVKALVQFVKEESKKFHHRDAEKLKEMN
ncbi:Uroporphyrinogen-III decarboxylase [Ignavibacterium album JCM 16511]|uniref:Uroporphyrinogen decarboxylase n=1 Tax=Ignavibacterium album (strain DSM 19864 / JCM 16511 / NBRC 101810 / Mat9-16) TaxID=945713 RepID=I0AGZ4_IGNAJ|nr:uroporphyrinogen decarboxylase [Ignavibacterium album]AFH48251.1 Uroporphyrinogen-III decarboxylase [Ignavibacterium album JCM 16511]